MQEYFTAVFKDTDQTKANKFLSIHVPEHKMEKLYASEILLYALKDASKFRGCHTHLRDL